MLKRLFLYFLALSFALTFTACDDDDDENGDPMMGNVAAIHAVGDAPGAVQVLVDDEAVNTFSFGETMDYAEVPAGDRTIAIRLSGSTDNLADAVQNVMDGANYSIVAHGTATVDSLRIELLALEDNPPTPDAGNAHIRVVHASATSPNVDVAATQTDSITSGDKINGLEDLAYGSASAWTAVPAGTYTVALYAAGTDNNVYELKDITLNDGVNYSVYAAGELDNNFQYILFPHN